MNNNRREFLRLIADYIAVVKEKDFSQTQEMNEFLSELLHKLNQLFALENEAENNLNGRGPYYTTVKGNAEILLSLTEEVESTLKNLDNLSSEDVYEALTEIEETLLFDIN